MRQILVVIAILLVVQIVPLVNSNPLTDTVVSLSPPSYNATTVANFVRNSVDQGNDKIVIMDKAYYAGIVAQILEKRVNTLFKDDIEILKQSILEFVAKSRNQDNGYGNWPGGASSLESTYQALEIYQSFGLLSTIDYRSTRKFIEDLQTSEGGFFPIPDWDAPDVTSTFRATRQLPLLGFNFSSSFNQSVTNFISGNYEVPKLLSGVSGYSEITNGTADLISTYYAEAIFEKMNYTDSHAEKVAGFLNSLTLPTGGIMTTPTSSDNVGYTVTGLKLYSILKNRYNITIFPPDYQTRSEGYLLSTKQPGSGFSSADTDTTASLSSTFFILDYFEKLEDETKISKINYDDVANFLFSGEQPTFAIGNYPGDIPDLSYTTRAVLAAKIIGVNDILTDSILDYVHGTYNPSSSGYAYRPGLSPTIKYTYYGIRALRSLNDPLENADLIRDYILSAQNDDGLFGKKPLFRLSYVTYTYWALYSLNLLDALNDLPLKQKLLDTLRFYRNADAGYANYPGSNSSIISTFRALSIRKYLGEEINGSDPFVFRLMLYTHPDGGFRERLERSYSTIEATYYGLQIADILGIKMNRTKIKEYVLSLQNKDGGFAPRRGFSSRITSTYYAVSLLHSFDHNDTFTGEDATDYYSPIIQPTFNKLVDNNTTIFGAYRTTARITDPEGKVETARVEVKHNNIVESIEGTFDAENELWTFIFGPYEKGQLEFRIMATDGEGNDAITEWFMLYSLGSVDTGAQEKQSLLDVFIHSIPFLVLGIGLIDAWMRKRQIQGGEIKMYFDENKFETKNLLNFFYVLLIMVVLTTISRIMVAESLLILQASIFIFRFVLGAMMIIFLRYVVGLKSFGFFGPSVIALSYLTLGPFWGTFFFLNLFILGIIVRTLIHPYGLPVGFRIGIVMVFVVAMLSIFEVLGEIYNIDFLAGSILVPILITPWITDRYVNDFHESSHLDAFMRLISTLFIILASYLVMSQEWLVTFVVINPEIWLLIMVSIFYLGRSRKNTIMDRRRFNRLFKPDSEPLTLLSRNRDFISRYNDQMLFPYITKFQMKEQFDKWKVPSSALLGVVSSEDQIDKMVNRLMTEDRFASGFAIKPSESYGGKGIKVVTVVENGNFRIGGELYAKEAIIQHMSKVINGEYLTSQTRASSDILIIEELIRGSKKVASIGIGLPDVRVIVFRGTPIMCMARLPTVESDGKANLKQGAIGAAIDMESGEVIRAEYKKQEVITHPDTKQKIVGFKFDNWEEILAVACLAQKSSGLGYAGVDIVLDENNLPLVLEINKRPGLEIQNINLASLLSRIDYMEKHEIETTEKSPLHCAKLAIELGITWRSLV